MSFKTEAEKTQEKLMALHIKPVHVLIQEKVVNGENLLIRTPAVIVKEKEIGKTIVLH